MSSDAADHLVCHSYTHGRRHPMVVGRIGGWTLPTPLSPAQLLVGLGTFSVLAATRTLWQPLTPGIAKVLVLAGLPVAAGWTVRHARVEGRSPLRAAKGLVALALAPRSGVVRGQAHARLRASALTTLATVVATTSPRDRSIESPTPLRAVPPVRVADADAAPVPATRPRGDELASRRWSCLEPAP